MENGDRRQGMGDVLRLLGDIKKDLEHNTEKTVENNRTLRGYESTPGLVAKVEVVQAEGKTTRKILYMILGGSVLLAGVKALAGII